jgi:hypothetical protein
VRSRPKVFTYPGETRVSPILLDTRELLTVGEGDEVWWTFSMSVSPGAIVRLQPPPEATDEEIERMKRELLRLGAAAVRAMPRRLGSVVPQVEARAVKASEGARQAAMALVDEAHTRDRDALRDAVEVSLAASGL